MSSRDIALISTATLFGALISAIATNFFLSPAKRRSSQINSCPNGAVEGKVTSQSPFDPSKRLGYLSWDDYFMAIAFLSAERSKDPNRQVGACLVSQNGVILGIGYNGFPRGCSDDKLPWSKKSKSGDPLETKYPYVCHAEVNAILNTNHASADGQVSSNIIGISFSACYPVVVLYFTFRVCHAEVNAILATNHASAAGQRLYVSMFPCNECAKIIIQSGVSEVIYYMDKRLNSDATYIASDKLLSMAGVKVRKHQPKMSQIVLKFNEY